MVGRFFIFTFLVVSLFSYSSYGAESKATSLSTIDRVKSEFGNAINRVKSEIKNVKSEYDRLILTGKFGFKGSFARSVLSAGASIDVANGISCLFSNKALGTSQTFTRPTAQLLGVVFLSAAAGKITTLMEGNEDALGKHCRNNIPPLGVLALSLLAVPAPVKFNKMAAVNAIMPPLVATMGLAAANYKGWRNSIIYSSQTTKNIILYLSIGLEDQVKLDDVRSNYL